MKNLTSIFAIFRQSSLFATLFIVALLTFSSCQKDDLLADLEQTEQGVNTDASATTKTEQLFKTSTSESKTSLIEKEQLTEEDNDIDLSSFNDKSATLLELPQAEAKNGATLLYQADVDLNANNYAYFYINKHDLNPNCKYTAKITRYAGDPDLFAYAGNSHEITRKIRRAEFLHDGNEEVEVELTDLYSHESRLYFIIYADQHQYARCKLEIFKDCGHYNNCYNVTEDCDQVTATIRGAQAGEYVPAVPYVRFIEASFTGDYEISHWEVNGERVETPNDDLRRLITQPGSYDICCYFWCNGQLYKCCQTITAAPISTCETILSDDFQQYNLASYIAQSSHRWETWDDYQEGKAQDAYVSLIYPYSEQFLKLDPADDVLWKLGNRSHGKYQLNFDLFVNGTAHFNIQNNEHDRISGGVFGATFDEHGGFRVTTNQGYTSARHNYSKGHWFLVNIVVDLDRNELTLYIDGNRFDLQPNGFTGLGALNLFAPQHDGNFQVDNLRLQRCN